ncbi:unnamed protein product [Nyctereutes procyonoides]|uniref:(raccoon dog) hypothetical protein n=1 Tax=Nyctereutes procyonoides TaxID=34880 RepID=A0A811Y9K2_NYCPR|nr:unnamed protein product [Nyctereutes procyonoides]
MLLCVTLLVTLKCVIKFFVFTTVSYWLKHKGQLSSICPRCCSKEDISIQQCPVLSLNFQGELPKLIHG